VFCGVLSPPKVFTSQRLLNTTGHHGNTTVASKTKNLYVPKTPEHHGSPSKYDETPLNTTGCQDRLLFVRNTMEHHGEFAVVLITFVVINYY
jgi:hypothetical protein